MPEPRYPLDVNLTDPELFAEVQLLALLITAANASEIDLRREEIDRVLFA